MAAMVARSELTNADAPATAGLPADLAATGPAAGASWSAFTYRSLLYGSSKEFDSSRFSARWNCRRESDDPITISSPGLVETSAGRLSRRLSLCARYTGPVQVFPSKEAKCSDHTVPIWFHQMGCALRTASHSLPDASTFRRGILFFGAGLGW